MKKRYASGWEPSCGRAKKYKYKDFTVDGTWELKFCEFMDTQNVSWARNRKRFPYTHVNGKQSTYQPDFYISDFDCYVEVKGYETELDRCKWRQFPHKLVVIRRNEIGNLDEWFKSTFC